MSPTIPVFHSEELRSILEDLAKQGHDIPAPKEVTVVASEDHDGDPTLFLTVVFPKKIDPTELPLQRIRPLIETLRERILSDDGYERAVIARIERLGDPVPRS